MGKLQYPSSSQVQMPQLQTVRDIKMYMLLGDVKRPSLSIGKKGKRVASENCQSPDKQCRGGYLDRTEVKCQKEAGAKLNREMWKKCHRYNTTVGRQQ